MSDKVAETKETQEVKVTSPEKKEVVCEKKPSAPTPEKESSKDEKKAEDKPETNGHSKTEETAEEKKPVENGGSEDVCSLPQKRKSEVGSGDAADKSVTDGASPEKKAKLEEKAENGEAEAKA